MPRKLPDAPLAGGIAVQTLFLAERGKQGQHLFRLLLKNLNQIPLRGLLEIVHNMFGIILQLWPSLHNTFTPIRWDGIS
ncbi:hypothetical protein D3C76_1306560 [compost metagenome]